MRLDVEQLGAGVVVRELAQVALHQDLTNHRPAPIWTTRDKVGLLCVWRRFLKTSEILRHSARWAADEVERGRRSQGDLGQLARPPDLGHQLPLPRVEVRGKVPDLGPGRLVDRQSASVTNTNGLVDQSQVLIGLKLKLVG